MFTSSVVDRALEPHSGHIRCYKIGICCFSTKHPALRRKSKDWLARNRDNVSEWGDMSFQWASTSPKRISSSSSLWKLTCSRNDIAEKLLQQSIYIMKFYQVHHTMSLNLPPLLFTLDSVSWNIVIPKLCHVLNFVRYSKTCFSYKSLLSNNLY